MAESLQIFFKLFGVFVTLFIIYLLVAGSVTLALYTRVGQGDTKGFWYTDRDKLKKYIFKSWIDWAGTPSTFSSMSNAYSVSYTSYKTLTGNNIISNCMLQCESANDRGKTPKCVGFIYTPGKSNTCNLVSTMDGVVVNELNTTLYFIDGLDTARQYKPYTSNTQADATFIDTSLTGGELDYLSNCLSLSDCTGVKVTGTTYKLVKNMDPTKFTADTNSQMVHLTTHGPLKASTITYY